MTGRAGRDGIRATGPTAEDGMVTAELAVALPTAVVVLLAAISALLAVGTQLRCTDAAATAARLVARGEATGAARAAALTIAGENASVAVATGSATVTVTVRAPVPLVGIGRLLHLPALSAAFTQPLEPGVGA